LIFAVAALAGPGLRAQEQPVAPAAPADADRPARGGRRGFDPAAMRDRIAQAIRDALGVTKDDEWAVIEPRLTKVTGLQRAANASAFQVFRALDGREDGRAGRRFFGAAMSPETSALVDALRNQAPDAEIQARLAQLRATRKQASTQLAQAQEDLRSVLSVRQEAIAAAAGLLP
jgi:hypothetical protein